MDYTIGHIWTEIKLVPLPVQRPEGNKYLQLTKTQRS